MAAAGLRGEQAMMQLARRASLVLVFLSASVGKFGWQVLEAARSRPW